MINEKYQNHNDTPSILNGVDLPIVQMDEKDRDEILQSMRNQ